MRAAGTRVYITGVLDDTGFSSGVDSPELLARLPKPFPGGIWTNKIEVIGSLVKETPAATGRSASR